MTPNVIDKKRQSVFIYLQIEQFTTYEAKRKNKNQHKSDLTELSANS